MSRLRSTSRGPGRYRAPVTAAFGSLAALLLAWGCGRTESVLPSEPPRAAESAAAEPTMVPRMALWPVSRRSPSPRVTTSAPPTATRTPTPTGSPTPPVPTDTPFPSATPTPTRTATPASPVVIQLRGIPFQWDFYTPTQIGGANVTLRRGITYELHIYNDGPGDSNPHFFSGIPALGIPGHQLFPGDNFLLATFTPSTTGSFPYLCTDSSCGINHANMTGTVQITP